MGARSLRLEQEKLRQRARPFHSHYELLSSAVASPPLPPSSVAYPPIFLPPSSTPSPSPLPAGGHHHEVPTAAIVGGGVASVIALAATATIAASIAGKLGVGCLLGPIGKLLTFLFQNLLGPAKSMGDTIQKWHQGRKQRKSKGAGADDTSEGSTSDWETQSSGSPRRASKEESSVAAAHSLTRSPRRNVDELDEDESKRRKVVHVNMDERACTTELQVREEAASVPALHKQETRYTGDAITNIPMLYGTMIPMPTKEEQVVLGNDMMSPSKDNWPKDDVKFEIDKGKRKRKRQSNLGHVSLSCDISLHYLRFFTACKSGGFYRSPMASPDHTLTSDYNQHYHHNENYHHDGNNILVTYPNNGKPTNALYQTYVSMHNHSQYNFMHQQLYHPSKFILVQHNTSSATPFATQYSSSLHMNPIEINNNTVPPHSPSKPSKIEEYGDPFDGVL